MNFCINYYLIYINCTKQFSHHFRYVTERYCCSMWIGRLNILRMVYLQTNYFHQMMKKSFVNNWLKGCNVRSTIYLPHFPRSRISWLLTGLCGAKRLNHKMSDSMEIVNIQRPGTDIENDDTLKRIQLNCTSYLIYPCVNLETLIFSLHDAKHYIFI